MQKIKFSIFSFDYGIAAEAEFLKFSACKFLKYIKGGATDNQIF